MVPEVKGTFNPGAFLGPIQSNLRATEKHAPTLRHHLNSERWRIGQENMAVACFQRYRSFIINGSRGLVNCFILCDWLWGGDRCGGRRRATRILDLNREKLRTEWQEIRRSGYWRSGPHSGQPILYATAKAARERGIRKRSVPTGPPTSPAVRVTAEDVLPVHTALRQVMRDPQQYRSRHSRHDYQVARPGRTSQENARDVPGAPVSCGGTSAPRLSSR